METVILAGGMGKRLRGVVGDCPKPMAKVNGRPFLEWLLLDLKRKGVRRIIFCTGYRSEAIQDYFGNGQDRGMEFIYSRENSPLGTGGALRLALPMIRSENFLVINGDSYCQVDMERLKNFHLSRRARVTLCLVQISECDRYGCVAIDETGAVQSFLEKRMPGKGEAVNAGIYLMERETVSTLPADQPISLETDFFPKLIGHGLYAFIGEGPFIDIGTPEDYKRSQFFFNKESGLYREEF